MLYSAVIYKEDRGFTLIEIITVMVIIILLAGMLFPALRGAITKSKIARTEGLINRIEAALYRYNSDYRDYPPSTDGGGGTINDNAELLTALLSDKGLNAPYESFKKSETAEIGGQTCLIDAWKHPLLYCHFTDYMDEWETEQPWRFNAKKYEFQLISPGPVWDEINTDSSNTVENAELNGLNGKKINKIIKNW